MPIEQLIKSRERVRTHGEVFTPKSMVDQMLDLVKVDLEISPDFVDRTFFEPSAGDGNFLIAILQRKLKAIANRYKPTKWPTEYLFALASIYGIELLEDNHQLAQSLLLSVFINFHSQAGIPCDPQSDLYCATLKIIKCNILQGNTLTGLDPLGEEIQFSWWLRKEGEPEMVKREPFSLSSLRNSANEAAMIDFAIYQSYKACSIEHVHKELKG